MDPTNPPLPKPNPDSSDTFPVPELPTQTPPPQHEQPMVAEPSGEFNPPTFHNPLSSSHDDKVGQLPDLATPQPEVTPFPVAGSTSDAPAPSIPLIVEDQASPAPAAPTATPPVTRHNIELPPEEPEVYQGPVPAPVRLAPEPRADDHHAAALTQAAGQTPFSGGVPTSTPTPAPARATAPTTPKKARNPLLLAGIGLLALLVVGGIAAWALRRPNPTASESVQPSAVALTRDQKPQTIQTGNAKVDTPCYVFQVPAAPTVNNNSDCKVDLTYGEQKISSIIVSTYREFDLVSPPGSESDGGKFDQKKVTEELIYNTTSGKTVLEKTDIKVGNIPAQKVIVGEASKPTSQVAYTYIVLPETDQNFNEKKFIAFIVTGAYGDDASRKGYDNALKWWYWK